jgi:hypothetical protein
MTYQDSPVQYVRAGMKNERVLVRTRRPTHRRIRRVKDWIEVEEALALLAVGATL